jgi:hypothetical protein
MTDRQSDEYEALLFNDPVATRLRDFVLDPNAAEEPKSLAAALGGFVAVWRRGSCVAMVDEGQ